MSQTRIGSRGSQFPVRESVGQQHAVQKAGNGGAQVSVPPASNLVLNGRAVLIDVRKMSGQDIVNAINNAGIPNVTASLDPSGSLMVTGIDVIDAEANLRALLGI